MKEEVLEHSFQVDKFQQLWFVTPRAHARARGYVIGRGVYPVRACASKGLCDRSWCLYIVVYKSGLFFGTNLLSPKILTFRGLF